MLTKPVAVDGNAWQKIGPRRIMCPIDICAYATKTNSLTFSVAEMRLFAGQSAHVAIGWVSVPCAKEQVGNSISASIGGIGLFSV